MSEEQVEPEDEVHADRVVGADRQGHPEVVSFHDHVALNTNKLEYSVTNYKTKLYVNFRIENINHSIYVAVVPLFFYLHKRKKV